MTIFQQSDLYFFDQSQSPHCFQSRQAAGAHVFRAGCFDDQFDGRIRAQFVWIDHQIIQGGVVPMQIKRVLKKALLGIVTFLNQFFRSFLVKALLFHNATDALIQGSMDEDMQGTTKIPQQELAAMTDNNPLIFTGYFENDGF